jgi:hypothetical protein
MPLVRNRWRYFFLDQDAEQETWLERQARRGLHLIRPGVFRFAFAQGKPREDKYRLDFQTLKGAARDEYLGLFRDGGWEFLGQVANRYYFRAGPGALSPEIFSDVASRKERIRRQMRIGASSRRFSPRKRASASRSCWRDTPVRIPPRRWARQ